MNRNAEVWSTNVSKLILAFGALLMIMVWFQNRGLFLDEANLARNILERDWLQLFTSLDYEQHAPPIYLVALKGAALLFGSWEWSLRLPSLFAGLMALGFFYLGLNKSYRAEAAFMPLAFFAFSPFILRYSTEVKQYSIDLLVGAFVVYILSHEKYTNVSKRNLWLWIGGGSLAIWMSMPSVFLLFGLWIGLTLRSMKDKSTWMNLSLISLAWITSFSLYYYFFLQESLGSEHLQQFHSSTFFHVDFDSFEVWKNNLNLLLTFWSTAVGWTVIALVLGVFLSILGFWHWYKADPIKLAIVATVLFAVLLASTLGKYAIRPRLILFIVPLLLYTIGAGWQFLLSHSQSRLLRGLLVSIGLVIVFNFGSWHYVTKGLKVEEVKQALKFLLADHPNEKIHVEPLAAPIAKYYFQYHRDFEGLSNENFDMDDNNPYFRKWLEKEEEYPFWILLRSRNKNELEKLERELKTKYTIVQDTHWVGAHLYLLTQ